MFDQFDAKYPTPAHAAAAERRERERVQADFRRGRRTVLRDRAAKVTIAAALVGAVAGALVLGAGLRHRAGAPAASPAATNQAVPAFRPDPSAPKLSELAEASPPINAVSAPAPRDTRRPATATLTHIATNRDADTASSVLAGSPQIAEPLQGEALRLALIEDRKRTMELNDAELSRLASKPTQ
jgi:hypothetical protein